MHLEARVWPAGLLYARQKAGSDQGLAATAKLEVLGDGPTFHQSSGPKPDSLTFRHY